MFLQIIEGYIEEFVSWSESYSRAESRFEDWNIIIPWIIYMHKYGSRREKGIEGENTCKKRYRKEGNQKKETRKYLNIVLMDLIKTKSTIHIFQSQDHNNPMIYTQSFEYLILLADHIFLLLIDKPH